MKLSKLVDVFEFEIQSSFGEEVLFRLEVFSVGVGARKLYRCRLYRLESFRFKILGGLIRGQEGTMNEADYRSWVVDDNMAIDTARYSSAAEAKKDTLLMVKTQFGFE